ncbi:hypothetical protein AtNW77_Chr5g0131261 [Arabidopsis thaliana]|uniref:Uncharacterized protein n=2 Tax=Arabidopsis TaxID=3701 RepID=A0A178UEZ4_ARATH|nr:hypothetical protein ISN45_At05g042380 [Arabidopsis thaliana x Arabidopsis arenosa]OAO92265.1 hypothetical protein AXX17_AT5G45660 [Arabidopsis thaliana]
MEKRSDTESSEILEDWHLSPPVNPEEGIVMVSVPTSPESDDARLNPPKEIETRVSDKKLGSTSTVAGEAAARRVLPPWMEPSYEWGAGKWKEDGRKKKKEKEKEEIIPFKEIIEALLRNSGDKVKEDKDKVDKSHSCVEILKSMGFKFPS